MHLLSLPDVRAYSSAVRDQGRTVVLATGCFDILHVGHVRLLREAREQGDTLIVGINADHVITRLKGPGRPVHDAASRAEVLSAIRFVDQVCVFTEPDPSVLIRALKPHVFVKGGDYEGKRLVEARAVVDSGGRVYLARYHSGYSSTDIFAKTNGGAAK